MNHAKAKVLSALLVIGVAIPAGARSAHERKESMRAEHDLTAMTEAIGPTAQHLPTGGEHRVTLNGAPLFFRKSTAEGTLDEVMAKVAAECGSGTESIAFGHANNVDDHASTAIRLERVVSAEAENGARASLCVFENDSNGAEELRRVRYTLANRRDDGSIAVTTVVNASSTPLQELFPAEGDAPGSDLDDVARPVQSRRTMTILVGTEHAVRVYESAMPMKDSIASYDQRMIARGFVTTGTLDEARMYRREGRSYVASFRATTEGSTVALMPFGGSPAARTTASD